MNNDLKISIRNEILKEHSKAQADQISNLCLNDSEAFSNLMELFFADEYRVTQRASWPLSILATKRPELFEPYLEKIILNLKKDGHDAVKRNSTKILLLLEIPDHLVGITVDMMFSLLLDKKQPVAIKANTISIIFKMCRNEPDVLRELKIIIEDQVPYSSPAFTGRAMKILKSVHKR